MRKTVLSRKRRRLIRNSKSFETKPRPEKKVDIFSFIYMGYNFENYNWEVIIFLKKLILTLIAVFSEFFPPHSKAVILIFSLIFFIYLNIWKQPYISLFLNVFDTISLIISLLTAGIGVLLFSKDLHKANPFFMALILLINGGFFVIWIYYFMIKSFGTDIWKDIFYTLKKRPFKILQVFKTPIEEDESPN